MTLVASFTFRFVTETPLVLPEFSGTIALSLLLETVSRVDPGLARRLHESRERKPYAVTPFEWRGRFFGFRLVPEGQEVSFRATVIGELARKFLESVTGAPPLTLEVGPSRLSLADVGASVTPMRDIRPPPLEAARVDFHTPVRFSVAGTVKRRRPKFRLFPTPEHVLHSLADHWDTFAPPRERTPARLREWAVNYAVEVDYRLRPVTLRGTKDRVFRGSIGWAIYRFEDERLAEWAARLLEYGRLVNVGTGRSVGLGVMTYRKA